MTHVTNQLLHWSKNALTVQGGTPVTIRRVTPYPDSSAGALDLSVVSEQSQDLTTKGVQQRTVRIRVVAAVRGDSEAAQDQLDDLRVFVETKFAADPSFGGLVRQYEYRSTEFVFSGNGDQPMCVAAMSFDLTLLTRRENPQAVA